MIAPRVHRHGTPKEIISGQYRTAIVRLTAAIEALVECKPVSQDYPDGGVHTAIGEHEDRVQKLKQVRNDMSELMTCLSRK